MEPEQGDKEGASGRVTWVLSIISLTRGHVRNRLLAEVCFEFLLRRRTALPLLEEAGKVNSDVFKVEKSHIRQQGQKAASTEHTDGVMLGWFHDVLRESVR